MLQASLFAPAPAVATSAPVLALRPYQSEALAAIRAAYAAGVRRPLVVLPTGAGKTVVFAHLIRELPGRALVLAHRDELIGQAADKLRQVDPTAQIGVLKAERDEWRSPVVVASVQSLAQPGRLARYSPGHFGTIVVDEAHHATAKTYRTILGHLGALDAGTDVLTVGVTATPDRGDGVGLGHVFERIVYERGLPAMIAEGYLVPLRGIRVTIDADFGTLRVRAGEVSDADAARLLLAADAPGLVAAAYRRHVAGQRAIVFTPTVQVAEACAAALVAAGVRAESLDGTTSADERRAILARLRSGATSVVSNCGVLTEGFDEPRVSCVIVARPTRSRGLYAQMVGRAARLYPGKTHATILDVVGSTREHQLVTLADLTGKAVRDGEGKPVVAGGTQGEDFQLGVPLDPTSVGGTSVDLFSGREFGWIPLGEAFVLPAGDGWVLLEPQPLDDERWWVIAQRGRGDAPELVEHSLDLGYAQGVAEDMVRRLGAAALARGAAEWRRRAASGGQMTALGKWGVRPERALTAGEASDLLTATIARVTWAQARKGGR